MTSRIGTVRSALLGLLFAAAGYTYALASSRSVDTVGDGVSSRLVGTTPVRFLNSTVSDGTRDLGDVTLGMAMVRYVRAAGGVGVLRYTSDSALFLGSEKDPPSITDKNPPVLSILSNGVLSSVGTPMTPYLLTGVAATAFPLSFVVRAGDQSVAIQRSASSTYKLYLEPSSTFKFAIANLGEAIQFQSFTDVISTVNGNGVTTVTASDVQMDGVVYPSLESIGLSLASDGTLAGVPLQVGVLTFTATAIDSKGQSALSRDLVNTGQIITLTISGNTEIVTQAVCQTLSLKIAKGTTSSSTDSLTYTGQVNLGSRLLSDLEDRPIRLTIGGYATPINAVKLLKNGKTAAPEKGASPKIVASVTQKGVVKISVTGENLSRVSSFTNLTNTTDQAKPSNPTQDLAVGVIIGDSIVAAQLLTIAVKTSSSSVAASYKFGATNTKSGAFIVTSVKGQDAATTAPQEDAWNVQFIALPLNGATFLSADKVGVRIGTDYDIFNIVEPKEGKNTVIYQIDKSSAQKTDVVRSLKMDGNKGTGSLITNQLHEDSTSISEAGASANVSVFPLSISVHNRSKVLLLGSNSLVIEPDKTTWSSLQK